MTNSVTMALPAVRRSGLFVAALVAMLCGLDGVERSWPQVPDNRGVALDPEDPVSPAYRETLDQRDRQRLDEARERGDSFMPMFHGEGRAPGGTAAPQPDGGGTDSAITEREPAVQAKRPVPVYETPDRLGRGDPQPDEALAAMVGVLLEQWTRPPEIARLRYETVAERPGRGPAEAGTVAASGMEGTDEAGRLPRIRAGAGFYARTVYAVDSDYPGPVVVEMLQPPLAGAVATGGFERVRQRLVLRLTSLTWRGATLPVDAWAVDPDCACYGIEGEVDRHFLARVVLPAAARFAEGFLNAAAMPARTLTMQDGTVLHERGESGTGEEVYAGLSAATRTLGDILMADAPRETTVRIPHGAPLVVMFAAPPGDPERTDGQH